MTAHRHRQVVAAMLDKLDALMKSPAAGSLEAAGKNVGVLLKWLAKLQCAQQRALLWSPQAGGEPLLATTLGIALSVRPCLAMCVPLPSWLRHRLCPVCSTAFAAKTPPSLCVFPLPSRLKHHLSLRSSGDRAEHGGCESGAGGGGVAAAAVSVQQLSCLCLSLPFAEFSRRRFRCVLCLLFPDEAAITSFQHLSPPFTAVLLSRSQDADNPAAREGDGRGESWPTAATMWIIPTAAVS